MLNDPVVSILHSSFHSPTSALDVVDLACALALADDFDYDYDLDDTVLPAPVYLPDLLEAQAGTEV